MDREVALTLLTEKCGADSRPVLSQTAISALLDQFVMVDSGGRGPRDADWEPTYDLNAAAAEGWRMKAGKVAGDYSFSADGASYNKADVMAHMLEMAQQYASKSHGVLTIGGAADTWPDDRHRDWDGDQGGGLIP